MYQKYHAEGFEIVGVDLDSTPSDLSDFLDKEKLPWINVVGEEKDGQLQFPLAEKYGIQAIPATFLVGKRRQDCRLLICTARSPYQTGKKAARDLDPRRNRRMPSPRQNNYLAQLAQALGQTIVGRNPQIISQRTA